MLSVSLGVPCGLLITIFLCVFCVLSPIGTPVVWVARATLFLGTLLVLLVVRILTCQLLPTVFAYLLAMWCRAVLLIWAMRQHIEDRGTHDARPFFHTGAWNMWRVEQVADPGRLVDLVLSRAAVKPKKVGLGTCIIAGAHLKLAFPV
jgi:hypothetical protein